MFSPSPGDALRGGGGNGNVQSQAEVDANLGFGDFDLFLPDGVQDVNGAFLEEPMVDDHHLRNNNWTSVGTGESSGAGMGMLKQEGEGGCSM
jgi:hypothetical protein